MKNVLQSSITKITVSFSIALSLVLSVYISAHATAVIDRTFGVNGSADISSVVGGSGTSPASVKDIAVQPDGKIVVTGLVFQAAQRTDIFVVRLLPGGALDGSFGTGGKIITSLSAGDDVVMDMELQSDGKIVLVGSTTVVLPSGFTDFLVLRYNANGTPDTTFGNNGAVTLNQDQFELFNKVAIRADGKILAVGSWMGVQAVMQFNADGTLDRDFASNGFLYYQFPPEGGNNPSHLGLADVEIQADARILVGGICSFDRPDNNDQFGYYIMRLRPDGSFDPAFGNGGIAEFLSPASTGWSYNNNFDMEIMPDASVAIVDSTGFRYTRFDGHDKYFPQDGSSIALAPNGRVIVSGGVINGSLKVYSKNALVGISEEIKSTRAAVQPDGKIITAPGVLVRVTNVTSQGTRQTNFNANDDKADLAIYRPSGRALWVLQANGMFIRTISNGASKVTPEYTPFSLNSNMYRQTVSYWNNGLALGTQGFFAFERTNNDNPFFRSYWGISTDVPYAGDFNGDGVLDLGVFRPSNGIWWGLNDNTYSQQSPSIQWGAGGDKPVPADYDGDGITDYAVYRPSNGTWWVRKSSDGNFFVANFGISTDIPLTGDFDGDGMSDFTVYRQGAWYQFLTTEGFKYNVFGLSTDIPVPADYDGDGRCDIAVYREGVWHQLRSREGYATVNWGEPGDVPVTARYDK